MFLWLPLQVTESDSRPILRIEANISVRTANIVVPSVHKSLHNLRIDVRYFAEFFYAFEFC